MSLGNHGIVRLVKYCSVWKKMQITERRRKCRKDGRFFGLTLVMIGSKWSKLADLWLIFKERNWLLDHIFETKKLYLQTTGVNRRYLNLEEYVLLGLLGESVHSLLIWPKLLQSKQRRLAHSRAKCPKRLYLWHLRN